MSTQRLNHVSFINQRDYTQMNLIYGVKMYNEPPSKLKVGPSWGGCPKRCAWIRLKIKFESKSDFDIPIYSVLGCAPLSFKVSTEYVDILSNIDFLKRVTRRKKFFRLWRINDRSENSDIVWGSGKIFSCSGSRNPGVGSKKPHAYQSTYDVLYRERTLKYLSKKSFWTKIYETINNWKKQIWQMHYI